MITIVFRCDGSAWPAVSPERRPPSVAPPAAMVKTFQAYLPPQCHRTYSCIHCRAHLANHDELISKSFQGSQGRAYLFNSVEERLPRGRTRFRHCTRSVLRKILSRLPPTAESLDFSKRVNVGCGPAEERVLLTGLHAVADIYCECCKTTLGWKYEHAFESSQKYKEGKFIIELAHMIKENGWD
ncbi:protein yippee-like 2 isoform X2 [Euwallacea fornicatus]